MWPLGFAERALIDFLKTKLGVALGIQNSKACIVSLLNCQWVKELVSNAGGTMLVEIVCGIVLGFTDLIDMNDVAE